MTIHNDAECGDVERFHKKFDQLVGTKPRHLTKRKLAERVNFMLEELIEFAEAAGLTLGNYDSAFSYEKPEFLDTGRDQDLVLQADALIDLVYVAKGTSVMLGLPWAELWDDVHEANMRKVKKETHRQMGYGSDIGKPEGWVGPATGAVLEAHGYRRGEYLRYDGADYETTAIDERRCYDDKEVPGGHK